VETRTLDRGKLEIHIELLPDSARKCRFELWLPDSRRTDLSGVNYFFSLTTIISPDQRQLLFDLKS